MSEYILKDDVIRAIQNDCLEQVYYTKQDAIDTINACDTINIIEIGDNWMKDDKDCYYITSYKDNVRRDNFDL